VRLVRLLVLLVAAQFLVATPAQAMRPGVRETLIAEARQFVTALFDRYRRYTPEQVRAQRPPEWEERAVYSRHVYVLLMTERDLIARAGEPPPSHPDPICRCRTWQDFTLLDWSGNLVMNQYEARFRFRNAGAEQQVRLRLLHTEQGWRVVDVFNDDLPGGLLADLRARVNRRLTPG